ncbi:MAG: phage tail tape measure protein [Bacteroidia bacterium]|nr:phage tail tape measure protein [Bacteroidia bacterium]
MAKKLRDEDLVLNIIVNGDQGKKEMGQLEKAIKDTNQEIRLLQKEQKALAEAGKKETEAYRALTAAIKEKNNAITISEARLATLRKGMKLTEMSMSDLAREQKRLTMLMRTAVPDSENYKAYQLQLKAVTDRVAELGGKGKETGASLQSMATKFNHYIGIMSAGILTITGIVQGLKAITQAYVDFEDKMVDVQKTTGLTQIEVKELNEQLKKVDSRSAQEDLLGLARVAGKLGISGKEDILGFVTAADKIKVALSEDLGGDVEESINQIGKLVDLFKVKDEFGIEQSMLKVGSAVNALGAASTASEGYLVEFTKRVGGVAPAAGVSIQNTLGLAATLDQLGQTAEVSATTFSQLIPDMFKNTAQYAKVAGMGVDGFAKLLKTDANAAMIKFLEGLKGNNAGMGEMVQHFGKLGIDGSRSVSVLSVLANNVGVLKEQQVLSNQEFKKGTSLQNEFTLKNENAAAGLEKAKKALFNMTVELGEKLYPVLTVSTSGFTYLVKILSVLTDFLIDNRKLIITGTAAWLAYNTAVQVSNLLSGESIVLKKLETVWAKTKIFWDNAQTAALHLLSAATLILRGETAAAKAEMVAFNLVTKMNPLGLLLAVLAVAVVAWQLYADKLSVAQKTQLAMNDVEAEAQKSIVEQKRVLKDLLAIAQNKNIADSIRIKAIKEINALSPEFLNGLTLENINTVKATTAIKAYNAELLNTARIKIAKQNLDELDKKEVDLEIKGPETGIMDKAVGQFKSLMSGNFKNYAEQGTKDAIKENYKNAKEEIKTQRESINAYIQKYSVTPIKINPDTNNENQISIKKIGQMTIGELKEKQKELNAELDNTVKGSAKYVEIARQLKQIENILSPKKSKETKDHDAELKAQIAYQHQLILGNKTTIEQEEISYQERLKKAGLFNVSKDALDKQLLSAQKSNNVNLIRATQLKIDALSVLETQHLANIQKKNEDQLKQDLDAQTSANDLKVAKTKELFLAKELASEESTASLADKEIAAAALSTELEVELFNQEQTRLMERAILLNTYLQQDNERDLLSLDAKKAYAAELDAIQQKSINNEVNQKLKSADLTRKVAGDKRKAEIDLQNAIVDAHQKAFGLIAGLFAQNSTAYKAFFLLEKVASAAKVIMSLQLELAAIRLSTALGVAQAMAIPIAGPGIAAGVKAAGVVQAVTAKISAGVSLATIAATAIGGVTGREDGGYTLDTKRQQDGKMFSANYAPYQRGYIGKPTLLVGEADPEFVANGSAVKNPTIKPFLDIIDIAQRNGTINTLNLQKYIERPSMVMVSGREQGGYSNADTAYSAKQESNNDSKASAQAIEMLEMLTKLNNLLSKPITAEVALLGRNGFVEKQKELTALENQNNL